MEQKLQLAFVTLFVIGYVWFQSYSAEQARKDAEKDMEHARYWGQYRRDEDDCIIAARELIKRKDVAPKLLAEELDEPRKRFQSHYALERRGKHKFYNHTTGPYRSGFRGHRIRAYYTSHGMLHKKDQFNPVERSDWHVYFYVPTQYNNSNWSTTELWSAHVVRKADIWALADFDVKRHFSDDELEIPEE